MERTKKQIAESLGVSESMLYTALDRGGLFKYKKDKKYHICLDFLNNLEEYFDKKSNTDKRKEKYKQAKKKISQWKRNILSKKNKKKEFKNEKD